MKPLTLVSVVTENYLQRAAPFLESLRRARSVDCYCVCLGFQPNRSLYSAYPHINFRPMPDGHWSADNGIFQHGRWLDSFVDVSDDHLYMLTDADILGQRDFTEAEIVRLTDYDQETFGAGWNAWENDDLLHEAVRMKMKDDGTFGMQWAKTPCYNTGVLVMRGCAWKRLRDLYESRVRGFWKLNPHRSRTQWLVNWCLHRLGMKADVLPLSLHAHGHHGIPKDVSIGADGIACYRGETILFRHAM